NSLNGLIDNKLVLAHLGSCDNPDEVIEKLAGKNVYLDTSFVLDRYPEKAKEVMKAHGYDKILFGTDSPWADQKKYVEMLKGFDLDCTQLEMIFSGNAKKLLNLG
ncbi:MAG: amidohydrolase family protein, partial [Oscillospiraceae bacterium]|nr:amidohydrolase family protein [Oscillospiraceae bacterium]